MSSASVAAKAFVLADRAAHEATRLHRIAYALQTRVARRDLPEYRRLITEELGSGHPILLLMPHSGGKAV